MNIALDYDGTYTAAPKLWDQFIRLCEHHGHSVICVTMRYPEEAIEMACPIIYTSRKAKVPFVDELGTQISIWIDDSPHWLLMSALDDKVEDARP